MPAQTIETGDSRTQSFADWLQTNSRAVTIGAVVILLVGISYWFYIRSGEIKAANAERGLSQAKQSLAAGNAALAQSDLQKVADRYSGTLPGAQAAMLLAQLDYDQGKPADGLKALEKYHTNRAAGPLLGSIWALTGDGQMASGKPVDAAESYKKAADATELPGERAMFMAHAGRAYMAAGRNNDARDIWQKLVDDPNAVAVQTEARVRLGELEAKPAGKS
ncbi:MAG TPA: tetratricopeptide repeat protein [Gemmatimonadaceae bacterium]|nr:tetratricopeptide repeat protein [Gemmatimonadaceae bacterium]